MGKVWLTLTLIDYENEQKVSLDWKGIRRKTYYRVIEGTELDLSDSEFAFVIDTRGQRMKIRKSVIAIINYESVSSSMSLKPSKSGSADSVNLQKEYKKT